MGDKLNPNQSENNITPNTVSKIKSETVLTKPKHNEIQESPLDQNKKVNNDILSQLNNNIPNKSEDKNIIKNLTNLSTNTALNSTNLSSNNVSQTIKTESKNIPTTTKNLPVSINIAKPISKLSSSLEIMKLKSPETFT